MTPQPWTLPEELRQLAEAGDGNLVKEVLSVFQSDSAERLQALRAASAAGDRETVRKQAHTLKGSSAQVGALAMSNICQRLESCAREASAQEIDDLIGKIEVDFAAVRQQMQSA